jgi:hypothetical protein
VSKEVGPWVKDGSKRWLGRGLKRRQAVSFLRPSNEPKGEAVGLQGVSKVGFETHLNHHNKEC